MPPAPDHAPLVSVVVPVFRTEEYLPACLASLLRQTLPDFEVIVVDDGSPGEVAGVVARATAADPRVRLVRHEENKGVALARLTGARAARGRHLAIVDPDDEVHEQFLDVLHATACRHGADLVQCGLEVHEPDGTTFVVNRGGEPHQLEGEAILHALLAGRMSNSLSNKLMATDLFVSVIGGLKVTWDRVPFGQDLLGLFALVGRARRFAHVPDALYRYLLRAASRTKTSQSELLAANIQSLGVVFDFVRGELGRNPAPAALVREFFEREFVVPVVNHFWRARDAGPGAPAGLPASPASLGLLGALVGRGLFVDDAPETSRT
ncbi:MAG: glycosyltransferase family 2 protein [Acidobacteria bacterium]|nr:glycosyltransferase family 2 protein [Acidobacteriota bacterium]